VHTALRKSEDFCANSEFVSDITFLRK